MDSGCTATRVVPLYEGHVIPHASRVLQLGGRHVLDYLQKLMKESGRWDAATSSEREILSTIQEKYCNVAMGDHALKQCSDPVSLLQLYGLPPTSLQSHACFAATLRITLTDLFLLVKEPKGRQISFAITAIRVAWDDRLDRQCQLHGGT